MVGARACGPDGDGPEELPAVTAWSQERAADEGAETRLRGKLGLTSPSPRAPLLRQKPRGHSSESPS